MARTKITPAERIEWNAIFFNSKKRKPGPKAPSKRVVAIVMREVDEMIESKNWSDAAPKHLVALFAFLHEKIYEVRPADVLGPDWQPAISAARKLVKDEFAGDYKKAATFVMWSWREERSHEKWRRENSRAGSCFTWRAQFAQRTRLNKYRIQRKRT